jgi:hypothetical protein
MFWVGVIEEFLPEFGINCESGNYLTYWRIDIGKTFELEILGFGQKRRDGHIHQIVLLDLIIIQEEFPQFLVKFMLFYVRFHCNQKSEQFLMTINQSSAGNGIEIQSDPLHQRVQPKSDIETSRNQL